MFVNHRTLRSIRKKINKNKFKLMHYVLLFRPYPLGEGDFQEKSLKQSQDNHKASQKSTTNSVQYYPRSLPSDKITT